MEVEFKMEEPGFVNDSRKRFYILSLHETIIMRGML